MSLRSFLVISLVLVAGTALAVHSWTAARYRADIAALKQAAAVDVAIANVEALVTERKNDAIKNKLEIAYVDLSEQRAAAAADTARLETDISKILAPYTDQAFESLGGDGSRYTAGCLRNGTGDGADGLSASTGSACNCTDLRAANAKLARALERLVEGGGGIVADGQRAADVATVAARFAREIQGGDK